MARKIKYNARSSNSSDQGEEASFDGAYELAWAA